MTTRRTPAAFTLIELLLVIAVVSLLLALMAPLLAEARRQGRMAVCVSQLKQHGIAAANYAIQFDDRIPTFTWEKGYAKTTFPDLRGATNDLDAAANQAVDILRRRAERTDIPRLSPGWIPYILYSHLVLMDFLAARLPEEMVACPADKKLRLWQSDPRGFDAGEFQPQPAPGGSHKRWPYSSSYQVPPSIFDRSPGSLTQSQSTCDGYWMRPESIDLAPFRLDAVRFPAQKAHVYDRHQRHFGPAQPFFGLPQCRQPILAFDGSVNIHQTADTNQGWQPDQPASPEPTIVGYAAQPWDPPTVNGSETDLGRGHYRWTRGGLAGVDWGGPEINTGQR